MLSSHFLAILPLLLCSAIAAPIPAPIPALVGAETNCPSPFDSDINPVKEIGHILNVPDHNPLGFTCPTQHEIDAQSNKKQQTELGGAGIGLGLFGTGAVLKHFQMKQDEVDSARLAKARLSQMQVQDLELSTNVNLDHLTPEVATDVPPELMEKLSLDMLNRIPARSAESLNDEAINVVLSRVAKGGPLYDSVRRKIESEGVESFGEWLREILVKAVPELL
ncbi:MAG: hypothetical protein M1829_002958 [Trizodia sp. TS-e1964]|nr:MAG: hypothetical protein M1829_002958 [Trizodia sp. TS-e1964]